MTIGQIPSYAEFEDYRENQRVAVIVRWLLVTTWLVLINYQEPMGRTLALVDMIGAGIVIFNTFLTVRILRRRPVPAWLAVGASILDLAAITAGLAVSNRFANQYYLLYYPAVMALALTYPVPRIAFGIGTAAAAAYATVSITLPPGLDSEPDGERLLALRIAIMYGIIWTSVLMAKLERERRRAAVAAAYVESQHAMEMQHKAQQAELAAMTERHRIATEIHDGIAQSIYALSLNLETAADLAERGDKQVGARLQSLVPIAKQTLLEARHYIFDLKPLLAGERDLVSLAERVLKEFETVANVPVSFSTSGQPPALAPEFAGEFYRVLREALANVLKHARAKKVSVEINFKPSGIELSVQDDGQGFDAETQQTGYGLQSMKERSARLGGECRVISARGAGTRVEVALPVPGGQ